ncbi:MAG: hypothetical protein AAFQ84_06265 [Pseudomonadota bacterium]
MTRSYTLGLTGGIGAGYLVLTGLLFAFHDDPIGVALDLAPFFTVGMIGIAFLLLSPAGPNTEVTTSSNVLSRISGCGQRLSWTQVGGLVAIGFFLGALLHRVIRLIA